MKTFEATALTVLVQLCALLSLLSLLVKVTYMLLLAVDICN